jgi:hypothetical protein
VPLDNFTGEYTVPGQPGNAFSVYVQDGMLTVESERLVPEQLKQISATVFGFTRGDDKAVFSLDASGRATSLSLSNSAAIFVRSGPLVRHVFHDYVRTEAMIPMRDGVKLHAVILKPSDIATPLPFLLERTPYGVEDTSRASFFQSRAELARDGYIYVAEDIRGRSKSQGKFIMMRPLADHHDPAAIDESTDACDTVAWLLQNVPGNNGRVGVVGTSYDGFLAMMAGIDPHPAVKAISPQAPMIDVWIATIFSTTAPSARATATTTYATSNPPKIGPRWITAVPRTACPSTASTTFSSAATLPATSKNPVPICCPPGNFSSTILRTIPLGFRARLRMRSTRSPCPRLPSAATTIRKICTARRKNMQS